MVVYHPAPRILESPQPGHAFSTFRAQRGRRRPAHNLPEVVNALDAAQVLEFLGQVQEPYQAALNLFYLEDYSYEEIANILEIPLGTVRSRISRGVAQLRRSIFNREGVDVGLSGSHTRVKDIRA